MKRRTKIATGAGVALAAIALLITQQEPEPLPMFAYEGDVAAGVDIPPRLYAIVDPNAHAEGVEVLPHVCKPGFWNVPCYVDTVYNGQMVRLRMFRCIDWKDPNVVEVTKADQKSCEIQKGFNAKLKNIPRR